MMGSGAETAHETVDWLVAKGEKVGLVKVRLYRPFSLKDFAAALPPSVTRDRGARPHEGAGRARRAAVPGRRGGASARRGRRACRIRRTCRVIVGGRYGLSSKEFTPAMVKAVFDELGESRPKTHFTVGITDDVTHLSLPVDPEFDIDSTRKDVVRGVFFGLGSDGTVGANKNSIKIIGEETDNFAQGYFVYDSKKAGAITISHLRFGPRPIQSSYLIKRASFVACHQFEFLDRYDVLEYAEQGAVFLLNAPFGQDEIWDELPKEVQTAIIEKQLKFYVIDAYSVAQAAGMGTRINTIMQTCFFAISGVLPKDEAIAQIKKAIKKTYGKRGEAVVQANFAAVDQTLAHLHEVKVPAAVSATRTMPPIVSDAAPDFVKRVTAVMLANKGDLLPVSAFPVDGTWPLGTTKWEKRNIAAEIPVWDAAICIQCNKCALVCPHAAIRAKVYPSDALAGAPATFKAVDFKGNEFKGMKYTIQVAPEDCTGCNLCVMMCPAKDKANPKHKALNMAPQRPLREAERENYAFFLDLPEADRTAVKSDVKGAQFLEPLFEYSGACAGCGETPYIKLLTQLFGDRAMIANATGCSSIYGGNLPTTPYTTNRDGRGPSWSNSLFEDNAEFGFGFRLTVDKLQEYARELVAELGNQVGSELADGILNADQTNEAGIRAQRERVAALRQKLAGLGVLRGLAPRPARRLPGEEERVDRGRRRLGLRHRLRRPRPRPRDEPRRERPGARHRGLLEHRRPAVEGHAARGRGQVRHGRQGHAEEGPGHDGHGLRLRVRRQGRLRREGRTDGQGVPGGGVLSGHRRSSSPTATASPTATTSCTASTSRSWRWSRATGRSTGSTRGARQTGRFRSCSNPRRPRSTWASTRSTSRATGWSSRDSRSASRSCSRRRRRK